MNQDAQTVFKNTLIQIQANAFGTPAGWNAEQEQHLLRKEIMILYFDAGTTTVIVGSRIITANPGDIVIVNPYEFHAVLKHEGDETDKYYTVYVAPDFILGMREGSPESRYLLVSSGIHADNYFPVSHQLAYIIKLVISEIKRQRMGYPALPDDIMHRFFYTLLKDRFRPPDNTIPREKILKYCRVIKPALEKIRTEYSTHITAEALAALCGVSKFHFCRIFKLVTGISPLLYLFHYRLQIAQAMLLYSNDTIAQISYACGFEDTSYFCRSFKRQFLFSAQKYRLLHTSPKSLENLPRLTENTLLCLG